jgi:hypothetical protein
VTDLRLSNRRRRDNGSLVGVCHARPR